MKTAEIRESFLNFFASKGCVRRPSSSLIPDDPSLLLTAAGMVQFKPVFLGVKKLPFTRATTVQKCVRTTDIDIIGTTGRHLSFFEMLGNFSFGDYFKREAIRWAWEFSIDVLKLEKERIWVSIYTDDDDAYDLWLEETDIKPERIVRLGEEDNFWAAGPTGPCGPCSELYYDQGPEFSCGKEDCAVGCDCDRYLEYWNLVFMQYDRDEDGNLTPLPRQNIDTGMGLERIAAILQHAQSNYDIDEMHDLITLAEEITGEKYGVDAKTDVALRIIADHARSVTFMIADGILPSNEGRGYVLRRLLRRAVRYGKLLGTTEPFMTRMSDKVVELMGQVYPEIVTHHDLVESIIGSEEERFGATLRTGLSFLHEELSALKEGEALSGLAAFTLHDTYGFPFDLTLEIAQEEGVAVDEAGYTSEMKKQKDRARSHVKDNVWGTYGGVYSEVLKKGGPTIFTGYDHDEDTGKVIALILDGKSVERAQSGDVEVILDKTPFYGEQGGQIGDTGTLRVHGAQKDSTIGSLQVTDTKMKEKTLRVHIAHIEEGEIAVGDSVTARIDVLRRERIRRNHTATHLLHWALHKVVGSHASQAGSLVSFNRLRFDFTHYEALSSEQLDKIERLVNAKIFENHPVRNYETSLDTARESGVTALFGEKYGDFVRVLEAGNFSKELCGGTHIGRTSEIGFFKIVSESSVGANLRRIEAVTSFDAYNYSLDQQAELRGAAAVFNTPWRDVSERAVALTGKLKEFAAVAKRGDVEQASEALDSIVEHPHVVNGYKIVVTELEDITAARLRPGWDMIRVRGIDAAFIIGTDAETGKPVFMAAGNDAAVTRGFNAGALVKHVAGMLDGRGGGKPTMAQGGGVNIEKIPEVLAYVIGEVSRER
ncbi:MAG: alanine--tRNA ligase [Coriobacteriia bacterium]|nr:alanine--tRNA ligase [Coriobacteriia bacterium]